ncbi:MAG: hypothetical protein Q8P33_01515 [bacterium]|nr:hypothetical protein [bacterium]
MGLIDKITLVLYNMRNQKQKHHRNRKQRGADQGGANQKRVAEFEDALIKGSDTVVRAEPQLMGSSVAESQVFTKSENRMLGFIRRDVVFAIIVAAVVIGALVYVYYLWGSSDFVANTADNLAKKSGLIE